MTLCDRGRGSAERYIMPKIIYMYNIIFYIFYSYVCLFIHIYNVYMYYYKRVYIHNIVYYIVRTKEAEIQLPLKRLLESSVSSLIRSWLASGRASGQKLSRL